MSHFALRESEMSSDLVLNENGQSPTPGVFVPPSNIFVLFFFFSWSIPSLEGLDRGRSGPRQGRGRFHVTQKLRSCLRGQSSSLLVVMLPKDSFSIV